MPAADIQASVGEKFRLEKGRTAAVGRDGLTIQFQNVPIDARCSVGSTCPDEGDAVVVLVARRGSDPEASFELHTQAGRVSAAVYGPYHVVLASLDPRPVGEQSVPLPHYTATLLVSTGARP